MKLLKYTAAAALGAAAAFLVVYFALAGVLVEAVLHIGSGNAVAAEGMLAWPDDMEPEKLYICADDGVELAALCFRQEEESGNWALVLHGYTSKKEEMRSYAQKYYEQGYSVLLPDQRAHGESSGEYCGMGWLERLDAIKWAERIVEEEPNAEIVLHGVSMGAAAALMAAGEGLPENVTAVVSDCAFTDVKSIMAHQLSSRLDKRAAILGFGGSLVTKLRLGCTWDEASAVDMVEKSKVPILFIHGGADKFVPTQMVHELYTAAPGTKELLIVPEAEHAGAAYTDTEKYWTAVFDFAAKHSSMHKNG
ncbi:MAG: alpha/beta hydrolase [Clostridiales bacterium]|nr:alpha/beta hydrolase [Clostridiales bacterium]